MDPITLPSVEDIQRLFSENRVFSVEDAALGDQVKEMQMKGFPIESLDGLEFCKKNFLDDPVGRNSTT
jgi:hypothetical protein